MEQLEKFKNGKMNDMVLRHFVNQDASGNVGTSDFFWFEIRGPRKAL